MPRFLMYYRPLTGVDMISITLKKGVAVLFEQTSLPRETFQPLFMLGHLYSPVVLVVAEGDDECAYTVAVSHPLIDLQWIGSALSRFDSEAWTLGDGVLMSPDRSQVRFESVIQTLADSLKTAEMEAVA